MTPNDPLIELATTLAFTFDMLDVMMEKYPYHTEEDRIRLFELQRACKDIQFNVDALLGTIEAKVEEIYGKKK